MLPEKKFVCHVLGTRTKYWVLKHKCTFPFVVFMVLMWLTIFPRQMQTQYSSSVVIHASTSCIECFLYVTRVTLVRICH